MKYTFFIPVLFVYFLSCEMVVDQDVIEETILDVNQNIKPKKEKIVIWQYPEETKRLKTGDCEDFVILCIDEIYKRYKVCCDMRILRNNNTGSLHAVLEYNGRKYECTNHDSVKVNNVYKNRDLIKYYDLSFQIMMHR
ncbi:MAG: hypothetical protein JXB50_16980 [Spirochaetes bacterium]|nr:hypothetical protein [Spirochaetota bacterium]